MKKLYLAAAVAAAAAAPTAGFAQAAAPASPHTFTANVGLFSEYVFRGIKQSGGQPAVQGGFDYSHASGFYLGTWASSISWLQDFKTYERSSVEWDFYGGYKGTFAGTDFGYDVGTLYYWYPGKKVPGANSADTWEIYGALTWKFLSAKLSYSLTDYFGAKPNANGDSTDGTLYLDFSFNYPIPNTAFSVNAHFGILDVANDGDDGDTVNTLGKVSYNDWKLGAAYLVPAGPLKDLEIGAYYADSDAKSFFYTDLTGGALTGGHGFDTSGSTLVLYVKKTF